MLDALKAIAAVIDKEILQDDFPAAIQPEFLRDAVKDYPCRGGKRLRPALLIWCCQLLGGDVSKAVPAAAAVEICHNWTLVHDDIIDNDAMRRGKPTAHTALAQYAVNKFAATADDSTKFGRDFAILAGDLQQGWAIHTLLKSATRGVSAEVTLALCSRMQKLANRELISGEAIDVELPYHSLHQITTGEVKNMLEKKTGALLRFCAEAGAAIALNCPDLSHPKIRELGDFAAAAGIAFQLRDDWLCIFGDAVEFGKPIGNDLSEAKPTILLLKALELLPVRDRAALLGFVGKSNFSATEIAQIRTLMRDSGAEKFVVDLADHLISDANTILARYPDGAAKQYLLELTSYMVNRTK
jgi:geranylgeranyl diphosphate synthase type I